jgi:3,4-dihydroxy 2-butanone 4-phosphate synthase/GTP cyclohydrolase II
MKTFDTIEEAILDIRKGKMIIVVDDEDRENEGDFVMAADMVTPDAINFMAKYGRGMICTPISGAIATNLNLAPMVATNTACLETAFTVTVDAAVGITTGISAQDRSNTIAVFCKDNVKSDDFARPGHIFPLIAKKNGVLERNGHTEAAVDFSKLAGFKSVGVICEIMNEDGTMSRIDDLISLKKKFNLKLVTIKDLITYRQKTEMNIKLTESIKFPNRFGDFNLHLFEHNWEDKETIVITKGDVTGTNNLLVRVHSECFTGDIFGSLRCDCGDQLNQSMEMIENAGSGMLIYLKQEGRGIGLVNKIKAYKLQEEGVDTVEANHKLGLKSELRDFSVAAQVLKHFEVKNINLITNNPLKINQLREYGIFINERVELEVSSNLHNESYLLTKKAKMGHLFSQFPLH